MGKKNRKGANDTPDTLDISCSHIRKGIDHSLLKRVSLNEHWNLCQDCEPVNSDDSKRADDEAHGESPDDSEISEDHRETPTVWMCLKCGHRGCGRNSDKQHAIKHFETPRSEPHILVLSLQVWSVWCYICDEEVQYSSTGQLAQLITNIRKQVLSEPGKKTSNRKGKKEESVVENPAEQMPREEKESKEDHELNSKHNDSPKKQKASTVISGAVPVRGLSNLGNTCFFNAVMQNLSQTHLLRDLLNPITDEKSSLTITPDLSSQLEPLQIQLERPGSLTLAMCQLLNEIQETKKGIVTPKELFAQVCKKASRFRGFQQQDSQELLRYLLDGMRAEEVKRVHLGILDALKNSGKHLEADQTKKCVKDYEKNGSAKNFVERVFGGELSSTVMCKECRTVSLVTEMFLDLSLPVADEAYRKKSQKKAVQYRSSVSADADADTDNNTTSLVNGNEEMPTGAGSKYQQKKAKKQAKKQTKNQRRQQKMESKVTLDVLTDENGDGSPNPVVVPEGSADVETGERTEEHQSPDTNASPPAPSQKDEDDEEPEQEPGTSVTNRFTALSEDHNSEEMSVEAEINDGRSEIAEEDGDVHAEEDCLVEELNTMSLDSTLEEHEMENGDDVTVDAKEYTVVNQDPELAFHTLATRASPEKQDCSVESCLYQFTEVEQLTENNRLMCVTCTKRQSGPKTSEGGKKGVYRDALKQMLISSPPPVLTLHLKRFQQVSYSVCKVNRHVQFPQILDLAPFCSLNCKGVKESETRVLYSLYGIVEHSGTMRSGHYTAYIKSRTTMHNSAENGDVEASKGSWFHVSDTSIHPVTEAKVQSSQAYLLFYEKML